MSREEKNMFTLRLPPDLYQKVKERASESNLSMTQFIIATLRTALDAPITDKKLDSLEKRLAYLESKMVMITRYGIFYEPGSEDAKKFTEFMVSDGVMDRFMEYRKAQERQTEPTEAERDEEQKQN